MGKLLAVIFSFVGIVSCSKTQPNITHNNQPAQILTAHKAPITSTTQYPIIGIWAMIPKRNGRADVVVFNEDGTGTIHHFNCNYDSIHIIQETTYEFSANHIKIKDRKTGNIIFNDEVFYVDKESLMLERNTASILKNFDYMKVDNELPHCQYYTPPEELNKYSPYQPSDFIANPIIPYHPNIQR